MVLVCGRLCVERCERKRRIKGVAPTTLFSGEIPPLLFSLFACSSGFILSVLGRISPGSRRLYFGARRSRSTPWDGQVGRIEATSPPSFILSSYQWCLCFFSQLFLPFVFLCLLERSENVMVASSCFCFSFFEKAVAAACCLATASPVVPARLGSQCGHQESFPTCRMCPTFRPFAVRSVRLGAAIQYMLLAECRKNR